MDLLYYFTRKKTVSYKLLCLQTFLNKENRNWNTIDDDVVVCSSYINLFITPKPCWVQVGCKSLWVKYQRNITSIYSFCWNIFSFKNLLLSKMFLSKVFQLFFMSFPCYFSHTFLGKVIKNLVSYQRWKFIVIPNVLYWPNISKNCETDGRALFYILPGSHFMLCFCELQLQCLHWSMLCCISEKIPASNTCVYSWI